MVEIVGNMHIHTPYSDGEKWHREIAKEAIKAGLDFIIVTDHNIWVHGVEGYYEIDNGRVLVLVGEEVHNVRRVPQANHFLVYGAEQELSTYAADPQKLIEATCAAGGLGFLAHPFERDLDIIHEPNLGWHNWEVEGFTGLEIWNYMSSFKNEMSRFSDTLWIKSGLYAKLRALPLINHPERVITRPEPAVLAKWDELLAQGKRIAAVGNSDAHGIHAKLGPVIREIFPYDFLFRAVNTHLLIPEPLNGDLEHDKKLILKAIGRGNSWVGYDMAAPTKGFKFSGQSLNKGTMGDEIKMDAGATLQVITPAKATIRLIRHGTIVAEKKNEISLTHIPVDPGAYRVECLIPYLGQERGWIYSNPIYLR